MKVEILKNCYVDGQPAKVGDIVDTKRAGLLIGCGKAKLLTEKKPRAKKSELSDDSAE